MSDEGHVEPVVSVQEHKTIESLTVSADGVVDILYLRTLTNTGSGEVLVRDVVREGGTLSDFPNIHKFVDAVKAAGLLPEGAGRAAVTKAQIS